MRKSGAREAKGAEPKANVHLLLVSSHSVRWWWDHKEVELTCKIKRQIHRRQLITH